MAFSRANMYTNLLCFYTCTEKMYAKWSFQRGISEFTKDVGDHAEGHQTAAVHIGRQVGEVGLSDEGENHKGQTKDVLDVAPNDCAGTCPALESQWIAIHYCQTPVKICLDSLLARSGVCFAHRLSSIE